MSSSTTKTKSSLSKDRFCSCGAAGCVIYPGRQCLKMPCKGSQCKRPIVTKIFFNAKANFNSFELDKHLTSVIKNLFQSISQDKICRLSN